MQHGSVRYAGDGCLTRTGAHHLEDQGEEEWCRICASTFKAGSLPTVDLAAQLKALETRPPKET